MEYITETRQIPVREGYDLIVAGGGIGGVAAALSAARHGLEVAVFEKSTVLGGLATLGLINWYEPLCDGEGHQLVTGIGEELLKLAIKYGYDNLSAQWGRKKGNKNRDTSRYSTIFNPAVFSLALTQILLEHAIEIKYDIVASYPVMKEGLCTGVVAESKSFREYFPAKVVIDATGDADILHRAGAPCRNGHTYQTYIGHGYSHKSLDRVLESRDMSKLLVRMSTGSDLYGNGQPQGMPLHEGISGAVVNSNLLTGQKMLLEKLLNSLKEERGLYALPGMAQLRKTRCLIGDTTFVGEDGKRFDDIIGVTGDFRYQGKHYEIPASILYHRAFANILAAGRTVSAQGDGWEVSRVIPTAALTGQAAGVYASKIARFNQPAAEIAIVDIQQTLEQDGVNLRI